MSSERVYSWRCRTVKSSADSLILEYLEREEVHPLEDKRDLILKALRAYYGPSAHAATGLEPGQLKTLARDSVFCLLRQVDKLCSEFNLERSGCGGVMPVNAFGINLQTGLHSEVALSSSTELDDESEDEPEENLADWNAAGLAGFSYRYEAEDELEETREH